MGSVVVTSDKEGGKPTSGYLPADPLLISDSTIAPVVSSHHPRSNSQTSCFQEDGYCIAVTKNAEGEFYSCFLFSHFPSYDAFGVSKLMCFSLTYSFAYAIYLNYENIYSSIFSFAKICLSFKLYFSPLSFSSSNVNSVSVWYFLIWTKNKDFIFYQNNILNLFYTTDTILRFFLYIILYMQLYLCHNSFIRF